MGLPHELTAQPDCHLWEQVWGGMDFALTVFAAFQVPGEQTLERKIPLMNKVAVHVHKVNQ
jgi:hypothetical protein